jgi:hypothetical protein
VSNQGVDLLQTIKTGLSGMKKTIRSMLFKNKVKNVRLVDLRTIIDYADATCYADPVQLRLEGYACSTVGGHQEPGSWHWVSRQCHGPV